MEREWRSSHDLLHVPLNLIDFHFLSPVNLSDQRSSELTNRRSRRSAEGSGWLPLSEAPPCGWLAFWQGGGGALTDFCPPGNWENKTCRISVYYQPIRTLFFGCHGDGERRSQQLFTFKWSLLNVDVAPPPLWRHDEGHGAIGGWGLYRGRSSLNYFLSVASKYLVFPFL